MFSAGLHLLVVAAWSLETENVLYLQTQPIALKMSMNTIDNDVINKRHAPSKPMPAKPRKVPEKPKPVKSAAQEKPGNTTKKPALPVIHKPVKTARVHSNTPATPIQTNTEPSITNEGSQQASKQQLSARIQKRLNIHIAYNYRYPRLAVRNAWEGRVKLGLRVQANGKLTDIHVINSSGHRVLDNAAVKSVRHVATLPEASDWLQGQTIDVILPVIYKLTDS